MSLSKGCDDKGSTLWLSAQHTKSLLSKIWICHLSPKIGTSELFICIYSTLHTHGFFSSTFQLFLCHPLMSKGVLIRTAGSALPDGFSARFIWCLIHCEDDKGLDNIWGKKNHALPKLIFTSIVCRHVSAHTCNSYMGWTKTHTQGIACTHNKWGRDKTIIPAG